MDSGTVIFFIFTTLNLCGSSLGYILDALDSSSPCPIYLTISSISHNVESSYLEINWGPKCPNPAEWIGLYPEDPSASYVAPLFTVDLEDRPTGHIKTNVKLGDIYLPYGWNKSEIIDGTTPDQIKSACLPFYIASFNDKIIQTLDCLKIQPNWMQFIPQIQNVPIKELFIPGTHCSGCYDRRTKTARSILLKKFGFVQNFDIWTQLVFGIRYLDISIGYKDHNNTNDPANLWIINEHLFVAPLLPALKDIRLFATSSNEMIIVNFVDFPIGFYNYPERHFELLRILGTQLGDIAYIRPWDNISSAGELTLELMQRYGKYIIILYNDKNVVEDSQLIWPLWKTFSTVNLRSNELSDYMRKIFTKKHPNSPKGDIPWVIYGIQGVDISYSPGLHLPSSRDRANAINKVFIDTISGAWATNANVVALDFFTSCNLIDLAIGTNIQKHFNNTDYLIIDIEE